MNLNAEDEGLRIRGRRLQLSDILGKSLQWKSFNGTWISGKFALILFNFNFNDIYSNMIFRCGTGFS